MSDQHDVPMLFLSLDQIATQPKSPMKDKEFIWTGDRGGWGQVADFQTILHGGILATSWTLLHCVLPDKA